MTRDARRRSLAARAWRPEERRVVARGLFGRLALAAEPAALAVLFAAFAVLLALGHNKFHRDLLSPIFALGAATFAIYTIAIMIRPIKALLETRQPIFIVDGYVRTRGRDDFSEYGSNGYVAVLLSDRRVAGEWPIVGQGDMPASVHPAYLEFSEFGGIHAIDGRPTGVLPLDFPALGIGGNRPPATD
mgnify:CR=1 FL=1